jgi:membrane protein implicated in regulation of membrane protease activity
MPPQPPCPPGDPHPFQPSPLWWFRQVLLITAACFFAWFGMALLAASYRLEDPFSFVMTFFSASLIILISAVLALGLVLRMRRVLTHQPQCRQSNPE